MSLVLYMILECPNFTLLHVATAVQLLNQVWPSVTPWPAVHQAPLSFTIWWGYLRCFFLMWARSYAFLSSTASPEWHRVLYTVFLCAYFKLFLLYLVISFCPNYHLLKLLLLLFLLGPFFIVFIEFTTILFLFLCFDFLAAGISAPPNQGLNTHPCHFLPEEILTCSARVTVVFQNFRSKLTFPGVGFLLATHFVETQLAANLYPKGSGSLSA